MARDFDKTDTNYMTIGTGTMVAVYNGSSKMAFHCWLKADTLTTGANDNRAFGFFVNGGLVFFSCSVDGAVTPKVFAVLGRSNGTDALQKKSATTEFTTGTWHSCGGVVDIGGDTITPYFNGAAEGGGNVSFLDPTLTAGTPTIGDAIGGGASPPTGLSNLQFDGNMAEFACWMTTVPSASDFAAMAKGVSPQQFARDGLVDYWPLVGRYSPETSKYSTRVGTITGTINQAAHPRIIYPRRRMMRRFTTAVAAGTGSPYYAYNQMMAA